MRNKFAGMCADGCGQMVQAGEGYFERIAFNKRKPGEPKWKVRCIACVVKKHLAAGVPVSALSHEQQKVASVMVQSITFQRNY